MNYFLRIVLSVLFCLVIQKGFSQKKIVESPKEEDFDKVFVHVPLEANTDPYQWEEHIRKRTKLSYSMLKTIPAGTYTAIVLFVVDKDGKISEVKTEKDPGYGLGKMAEKIIREYKGEWQPGIQCGRAVKSYVRQPIKFVI